MKRKLYYYIGMYSLFLLSCTNTMVPINIESVVYKKSSDDLLDAPFVVNTKWVPLETTDLALIGRNAELRVSESDFFIVDKHGSRKIFRFDFSGRFLNSIGNIGRGANEYLSIHDVVIQTNGNVEIFSPPQVSLCLFSTSGLFLSRNEYAYPAHKMIRDGDGYWLYTGFGNGIRPERLIKIDTIGRESGSFLPSTAMVLHMTEDWPVFSQNNDRIFMRERLNSTIYELSGNEVKPIYQFDFGQFNVPPNYFEHNDAFTAAETLFSRPFIAIERFMENDKYAVVQGLVNNGEAPLSIIGIKEKNDNGNWYWFDCMPNGDNPLFFWTFLVLTDNSDLFCLIQPEQIITLKDSYQIEVLRNVHEEDNPIILILQLR